MHIDHKLASNKKGYYFIVLSSHQKNCYYIHCIIFVEFALIYNRALLNAIVFC